MRLTHEPLLAKPANRGRNASVLQHAASYVRKQLDVATWQALARQIDDYRQGLVPLVVPVTLLRDHVRRLGVDALEGQVYLEPHPKELMLRNHV